MNQPAPGFANQPVGRIVLRVLGVVLFGAGLLLTVIAFMSFADAIASDSMEPPSTFFLAFIGLPLMGAGSWCLKAGFLGVAARYAAGEVAAPARDTLAYVGPTEASARCASCGSENASTARFCDDCGAALSRACPACSKANAGDARFCADCGAPV